MKVLILANDYKTIANFRMELLERFVDEKYEVFISVPGDLRNEQFRELGCTVIENQMTRHGTNPIAEWKLIREYKTLIKSVSPDIVLTYTIKPNIYGSIACRKCKVPVLNNVTGIGSTMQKKGIKQSIMFALMKYSMRTSCVIFFQNKDNMQRFTEHGIGGGEHVLLPGSGVNLEKHTFVSYPPEEGKIKIIVVSRVREDKGFGELFAAIEQLGKRRNIEYHIVGWCEETKYESEIYRMTQLYPVIYHGEKTQQEVHELIAQCHCIVHPSYHEGMANVLLEASATGRACLASNIPGCQEIIENGVTGYTFAAKNTEELVSTIETFVELSSQKREEMGKQARIKMKQEFDRQFVVNTYLSYINKFKK